MVAADTNILVRYTTNDDPKQAALAAQFLSQPDVIFIAKTVLLELEWVLRSAYSLNRGAISKALFHVVGLPNVVVEDTEQVAFALQAFDDGLDFADALHLAASRQVAALYTFDKTFAKRAGTLGESVVRLK